MALLLLPSDVFLSRAGIPRMPSSYPAFQHCARLPHCHLPSVPAALEQPAFPIRSLKALTIPNSSHLHFHPPGSQGCCVLHVPEDPSVLQNRSLKSKSSSPVFSSAHPDPQGFLEALQDCTSRHNGNSDPPLTGDLSPLLSSPLGCC